VISIPSHILESGKFTLTENLLLWQLSHELQNALPVLEAWEMQSSVIMGSLVAVYWYLYHGAITFSGVLLVTS
jgi:hypothetical protein